MVSLAVREKTLEDMVVGRNAGESWLMMGTNDKDLWPFPVRGVNSVTDVVTESERGDEWRGVCITEACGLLNEIIYMYGLYAP